jgi:hypothetical protein
MPTRNPNPLAKNDTGEFAQFQNFVRRLAAIPHSEIKAALRSEKEAKQRKIDRDEKSTSSAGCV